MITVTTVVDMASAATSRGGKTRVSALGPTVVLSSTSTGVRRRATWRGLLSVVLMAYSGLAFHANRTPTAFSTALDAMATTTRPVNVCERPKLLVAFSRGLTNQSEASAAPALATASSPTERRSGHAAAAPDPSSPAGTGDADRVRWYGTLRA